MGRPFPQQHRMPTGPLVGNGDLGASLSGNATRGELVVSLGLNQMWAINSYAPHTTTVDNPLPRRLALGGLTISARLLAGGSLSFAQDVVGARASATLTGPNGASLRLAVFTSEEENVLAIEMDASDAPGRLALNLTAWATPLGPVCSAAKDWAPYCAMLDGETRTALGEGGASISVQAAVPATTVMLESRRRQTRAAGCRTKRRLLWRALEGGARGFR